METNHDNTNRGVLFPNKEKKKTTSADYEGNVNVEGIEKKIFAWEKTSRNGNKYISLSFLDPLPKEESGYPQPQQQQPPQPQMKGIPDDDIPF